MRNKLLFIVLLVVFVCVGCQAKEGIDKPIKIAYIGPLTGEVASVGEAGVSGAELAVWEINRSGGVLGRKLELVVEDDRCSANVGVEAMNKLVNVDKVAGITGPDCGSVAGAVLGMAQEAGVPTIIRWASVPGLTQTGDYIFRIYPSDLWQGKYVAEYIFNELGKTKASAVCRE